MGVINTRYILLLVQILPQTEYIHPPLADIDLWTPAFPQVTTLTLPAIEINTKALQTGPAAGAALTTVR